MTQTISHARRSPSLRVLMISCASAAVATAALFPQAARAQAFHGAIASSTGSVTRTTPTSTTETLTIGSNTATINWSPDNQQQGGGPIDFLPNGNTATFTSAQGVTDYTVLNRILPDSGQAIALNGHVISTLQGTSTTGGHVWFYAPGGIVVGATAVFDVGGLLLTTNDVTSFGTTANGFNASFSGAPGSTSSVQIQNGAKINALQQNSYVALVAPRIEQGGTVRVNGSAAYAAGEQLSLTMNQGLFDIQVDVGTSDTNGIVHTGETSGPANVSSSDNHKIYMVAVPKNQALTMLLNGTVGFDDATSATVKNGQIFLSSGWGLHDSDGSGFYYTSTPGLNAGITMGAGNYTSDVTAYGQGTLQALADTGNVTFKGNVLFDTWSGAAPLNASLIASNEHTLRVAGNVTLDSPVPNVSGSASIIANSDGLVDIAGSAALFSSGAGGSGGDSSLVADGGTVTIGGLANINAGGNGGAQISSDGAALDGYGGSVSVYALDGGSLTTGAMVLNALGGGQPNTGTGAAGNGYGGSVAIQAESGGSLTVNGNLTANASGVGGNAAAQAGSGQGGSTDLLIDGGAVTVNGNALFLASGSGGSGLIGGEGDGGSATTEITGGGGFSQGGTLTVTGSFGMQAQGNGGKGADNAGGTGGEGGDGYGGYTSFYVTPDLIEGATVNIALGDTTLRADGNGGAGGSGLTGGNAGNGYGGSYYNVDDEGGYFGSAGVDFQIYGGTATLGNLSVFADGSGGNGGPGSGGVGGSGGIGQGGDARLELSNASVTAHDITAAGRGFGGVGGSSTNGLGGDGGDAFGGTLGLNVDTGGNLNANVYIGLTNGIAGNAGTGTTGAGVGGAGQSGYDDASIDGTVTVVGQSDSGRGFVVTSFAQGGNGDTGGAATAGGSSIEVSGSLTSAGIVQATAQAGGGIGVTTGGSADGGSSSIDVSGNLTTDTLTMLTNASAGSGASTGGDATAGSTSLFVSGGTTTVTTSGYIQADATGGSSSGGSGGSASAGNVLIQSFDDSTITGGSLSASTDATGGNGTTAGSGAGGGVFVDAQTLQSDTPANISLQQLTMTANGMAGTGGGEVSGSGGSLGILAAGSAISVGSLTMTTNGTNSGGFGAIQLDTDSSGIPATMQFGSVTAQANGQDMGGQIFISSAQGGSLNLGNASLQASGGFGGQISLLTGYCLECGGAGDAETLHDAALPAAGGIAADNLTLNTTGNIFVSLSGGADVSVSGKLNGTAGQMISLVDDESGGVIRAHEIDLTAITINDSADIIADIINFTTPSQMTLGNLSATDSITLTSGDDLTTGDLTAGNAITLNSQANVAASGLSAQTVNVTAAAGTTIGDVQAPGSATFSAGGLAAFTGTVSSPTITVTSSDLDVTEGASLGVSGVTNLLTLNAISHGLPIIIGGTDTSEGSATGQYQLGEDGTIRATSVVINATGAVQGFAPDVQVNDINVEGSNTSGGGITNVTLNTGGSVFVDGKVDFADAGANNTLTINAGHAIEVNTDTGGIQITDSSGALTGTLALKADNIWVASGSLLDQLEADVNFAGRNAALGVNSGTANQDGFLRAGTIQATVADTLLVQNSGTPDLFGGIDTGAGGLSIVNTGATPAALIVFGRQTTGTGTVITNQDFLGTVDLSGTGGFTDDSSVNGCAIGGTCGQAPTTPGVDMASILGPLDETNSPSDEDKKKKDKDSDESDDGSSADPSLRLINTTPINNAPPIDEPVTSGGDLVIGGGPVQPN